MAGLRGLVDLPQRQSGRLRQLLSRRLAPERTLEIGRGRQQPVPPLEHVDREPDRPRLPRDRPLDRMPDPPGRVGRDLVAVAPVELLDGGATVPFIARYRKEATGTLDDAQLRTLEERLRRRKTKI